MKSHEIHLKKEKEKNKKPMSLYKYSLNLIRCRSVLAEIQYKIEKKLMKKIVFSQKLRKKKINKFSFEHYKKGIMFVCTEWFVSTSLSSSCWNIVVK